MSLFYFEIVLFQHNTNLHGNIAFSFHIRVHTYLKPSFWIIRDWYLSRIEKKKINVFMKLSWYLYFFLTNWFGTSQTYKTNIFFFGQNSKAKIFVSNKYMLFDKKKLSIC